MNAHKFISNVTVLLLLPVLLLAPGCGERAEQGEAGWTVLFDGGSTEHWRGFLQEGFPGESWTVENDALKPRVEGPVVDLITRRQFENYELELEWRVDPRGNAGIFFHVTEDHPQVWETGPEFQVLDDDGHPDGLDPKTSAGSVYGLIAPQDKTLRPVGEYNQARIVIQGSRVEHWLNGVKVVEFDLDSEDFRQRIAETKFSEMSDFARHREGHIALQHASVSPLKAHVWYRNVRIREIPR